MIHDEIQDYIAMDGVPYFFATLSLFLCGIAHSGKRLENNDVTKHKESVLF